MRSAKDPAAIAAGGSAAACAPARLRPVDVPGPYVTAIAALGLLGGLVLLARGLAAFRGVQRVSGIGTSRIATVAAGEVRIVGLVETDVLTLVSPLQSVPSVYFRSRIREGTGDDARTVFADERAVGFRVRDASGSIRVFPRGARWDAPLRFDAASDWAGGTPPGLRVNPGPAHRSAVEDREALVAELLTVHPPADLPGESLDGDPSLLSAALGSSGLGLGARRRDYEERRLEPGDTVTIVGSAVPFGDLDDPAAADRYDPTAALDDPEVAMNLAEARAAGILAATPEEAWGNAAIPGFGIGRPTRAPELDPGARVPALAGGGEAAAADARFEIPAGELVVGAAPERPLAIVAGTPGDARAREDAKVLLGLAGAAIAIVSAMLLALSLPGALR